LESVAEVGADLGSAARVGLSATLSAKKASVSDSRTGHVCNLLNLFEFSI
jgi:hypothetical protein